MHRRLFLSLVPGLVGCAGVSLRSDALDDAVRVRDVTLVFTPKGEGSLTLVLDVDNPSAWDATLSGVDYTLRLDGRRYAVGTRGEALALAARAHQSLTVSFPLVCEPQGASLARTRSWRVAVDGAVALTFAGHTVRRLPFRDQRDLRLARFQPLQLKPE